MECMGYNELLAMATEAAINEIKQARQGNGDVPIDAAAEDADAGDEPEAEERGG